MHHKTGYFAFSCKSWTLLNTQERHVSVLLWSIATEVEKNCPKLRAPAALTQVSRSCCEAGGSMAAGSAIWEFLSPSSPLSPSPFFVASLQKRRDGCSVPASGPHAEMPQSAEQGKICLSAFCNALSMQGSILEEDCKHLPCCYSV